MKKFLCLLLALIMLFSCSATAYAMDTVSKERIIQEEIELRENAVFASVKAQLEAQNALDHLEYYEAILRPEIEMAVRAKYGAVQNSTNSNTSYPYGAVMTYFDELTRCYIVETYLDFNNSYYYVLGGSPFSPKSILEDFAANILSLISPLFGTALAFGTSCNSLARGQILQAGGYARIINVESKRDYATSSVVCGWENYPNISDPGQYASDLEIFALPEHNPFE